jgi:hypothetical protein
MKMEISVKIVKENKDGSAEAIVRFDKKGLETLVQWGLVGLLTKAIDEYAVKPEEGSAAAIGRPKKRIRKLLKDLDVDGRC